MFPDLGAGSRKAFPDRTAGKCLSGRARPPVNPVSLIPDLT
jgi:hypothetical protein